MNLIIVTPAYNEEKRLTLLIDSVVSQSKLPTEWIIVDDGSTDNTSNVIQRAAVKHKWITYLRIDKDNNIDYYLSHLEAFYYGFNNKSDIWNEKIDAIFNNNFVLILGNLVISISVSL